MLFGYLTLNWGMRKIDKKNEVSRFRRDFVKRPFLLIISVLLLVSCNPQEDQNSMEIESDQNSLEEREGSMGNESLTRDYLSDRIQKGMDVVAYSVEIRSWVDKGMAKVVETIRTGTTENFKADIIKVSDGYLAVLYDGKEVTEVETFSTEKKAKEYLE